MRVSYFRPWQQPKLLRSKFGRNGRNDHTLASNCNVNKRVKLCRTTWSYHTEKKATTAVKKLEGTLQNDQRNNNNGRGATLRMRMKYKQKWKRRCGSGEIRGIGIDLRRTRQWRCKKQMSVGENKHILTSVTIIWHVNLKQRRILRKRWRNAKYDRTEGGT